MTDLLLNTHNVKNWVDHISNKVVSTIDFPGLKSTLCVESCDRVYSENNATAAYDFFIETVSKHINNCSHNIIVKKPLKRLKPWINSCLVKKVNKKNKS